PDCLLVRKEKNEMSYDQTILMATVMSISGGMLLVSDNLKNIEEDRLGILRKSLELNSLCQSRTPLPLGTFENEFPRGLYNPAGFIGIWNPTETDEWVEVKIPIPFKQKNPKDFWTGESLSNFSFDPKQGRIKLKLKPFGSAIIKI
ncbi:MAG: alpha-galactosidase, partial [Leptospira sp.]|nr:alpha-galactosidase [Leptospira sp.]